LDKQGTRARSARQVSVFCTMTRAPNLAKKLVQRKRFELSNLRNLRNLNEISHVSRATIEPMSGKRSDSRVGDGAEVGLNPFADRGVFRDRLLLF